MNDQIIYIAVWEDRHTDVSVHAFSSPSKAIEWAKAKVQHMARGDFENIRERLNSAMVKDGWIYYGRYSRDGGKISVRTITIDAELGEQS